MRFLFLKKFGALASVVAVMACPACWPLFAGIGSALGLGFLASFEGVIANFIFPVVVVIAIVGNIMSYRFHRKLTPLVTGLLSGGLILFGFYILWLPAFVYAGIFGILTASVLGHLANRRQELLCQA